MSARLDFLPAAIEVEERPASRAGRFIIWLIVLLFCIAVLWACYGRIDIVAVAQGKIIPSDQTKQIQALELATVTHIHVREGQTVRAGDPLITLDSTQAVADLTRIVEELAERQANASRLIAFDLWLKNRNPSDGLAMPVFEHKPHLSPSQIPLYSQDVEDLQARLLQLSSERDKLKADQSMLTAEITKLQRILPVLKERVEALNTLQQKSYGSKLQYLELKQELIELEENLVVQLARKQQLLAALNGIKYQCATLVAERRKYNLDQLREERLQITALEQERIKAERRTQHHQLLAPISGQVQQLSVHTIGGVVQPAQILMAIVPQESALEVEALILNKDIGFVEEGQATQVKIDTFNFTKYGLIEAELLTISDDAIQHEQLGLVYSARIRLFEDFLNVGGRSVRLSPGMTITAEVKTGTRRIIEFFLSPLLRYKQESLVER